MAEGIAWALYLIGFLAVLCLSGADPRMRGNEGLLVACAVGWPFFALFLVLYRIARGRHG